MTNTIPAELYRADRIAPLLDSTDCTGDAETDAYRGLGFLAVRSVLTDSEVRGVLDALAVDGAAPVVSVSNPWSSASRAA
ncbi:hypothetical protein ACWCXE_27920 [Streptomyces sp. NPDC001780]